MKKKYCLYDINDLIALAKYIQVQVYWGGYFIRKDNEQSYPWKDFWDHLTEARENGPIKFVIIDDTDRMIEFA